MARKKSPFKLKLKRKTLQSLLSFFFFGLGTLILLSMFLPGGILGGINEFFNSVFGWGRMLFAVTLFQVGSALARIKVGFAKMNVILGFLMIEIALIGLSQSGSVGLNIYQTIYSFVPFSPIIFLGLLMVALLGATVMFGISIGEALTMVTEMFNSIKTSFNKMFKSNKKPATEFIKDNQVKQVEVKMEPKTSAPQPVLQTPPPPQKAVLEDQRVIQNESGDQQIWEYPPLSLLSDSLGGSADRGDIKTNATTIEKTLDSFGITAKVAEINKGPAVTQYALEIALGTKLSKITALQNDLALALAAPGQIRIEAPIAGRKLVGVEIPNIAPEFVTVRSILESDKMRGSKSKLAVALGLDVAGQAQIADITKMPHLLIAGATGSGKSIGINAFLTSLLYRNSPSELKLILVDPKRVELSLYNGIPHLLTPVIVEVDKVLSALKWGTTEMERRYKLFATVGVRNIESYNELSGFQALPYLVIVIDEMADVMMFAPVEVEDAICRLAQMARATGIHLILSTQRPSVDVLTGLIKANIPTRIAFNVTSMIDSRVIIDNPGAEKLLGKGDMLFIPPDQSKPARIQGAFVSETEVHKVVDFLKTKGGPVQYTEEVTQMPVATRSGHGGNQIDAGGGDPFIDDAIRTVCQNDRASASLLQRKLSIGYARAARILDTLQEMGIVGPGEGSKARDVLVRNADEYFAQRAGGTTEAASPTP